ncbi:MULTISPECIES: primosomal replication protein PriB/PriC domain protein [unclassified Pseudomonas]|uniref:primosomal replication protein PriB/PriC domain protein n=1 Tax=unclassified Pseudomonas TaxID=196821 RepID=UPI00244690BD|nr:MULTISPECIES: primosomal replication protein PriB/PriC domain protein [unclassified Pseudomonas]MDG9928265.1 primosomal replication protein PriB/PriC domain protein [Pseudomonas sp. GD04042]MDH0481171.1 primosomal replication protein PriB/PriC domain protein [Pseudomonas sp. GD04015]MDH0604507.1 primosomal replication protein PriB/PriC domain protein [Pseudomonas sp. GD03869]
MATVTLEKARQMLKAYLDAEFAVSEGRTVSFGGRSLTSFDLAEIRAGRQEWERKVKGLERAAAGGSASYKLATFD